MSFKSEAQKRKFASLVKEGKMKQSTFDEWEKETKGPPPERISNKPNDKQIRTMDDVRAYRKRRIGR